MAASTDSETLHRDRTIPSRYDLVLAVIPAAFLVALFVSIAFSVPLRSVLVGSALFCTLVVADGLYLNPPTDGGV